jgi:5'-3' exonuclease
MPQQQEPRHGVDTPGVDRVVIMTPDKDMGQCVREDGKVVQYDRRQRLLIDADGVRKKFGVSPVFVMSSADVAMIDLSGNP